MAFSGATPTSISLFFISFLLHHWWIDGQTFRHWWLVPVGRLELPTHSLKGYCSSYWATRANGVGYCIVHNPLLLQPLRHWFTFISRKHEHLAVEDFIVKVLLNSRGSRFQLQPCIPHCPFIVSQFGGFVKRFLHFFRTSKSCFNPMGKAYEPSVFFLLTPLLYHNLGGLSRGFFTRQRWDLTPSARTPAFNLAPWQW